MMDGLKAAVRRTDCRVKTGNQEGSAIIQAGRYGGSDSRVWRWWGRKFWILELTGFTDGLDGAVG